MQFTVPGKIYGKARARTFTNRYTGKVQTWTPEKTTHYEDLIRYCYKEACNRYIGDKPFILIIRCYKEIPKSYSKKKKEQCLDYEILPTGKPDTDNIAKVNLDALNSIAYKDDKGNIILYCDKRWSSGEEYAVCNIFELTAEIYKLWLEQFDYLIKTLEGKEK